MIDQSIKIALDIKHLKGFDVIDYVLSKHVSVSRNSVEEAYRRLLEERIYNDSKFL